MLAPVPPKPCPTPAPHCPKSCTSVDICLFVFILESSLVSLSPSSTIFGAWLFLLLPKRLGSEVLRQQMKSQQAEYPNASARRAFPAVLSVCRVLERVGRTLAAPSEDWPCDCCLLCHYRRSRSCWMRSKTSLCSSQRNRRKRGRWGTS